MYSSLDRAYRDDISGSDVEMSVAMVAFIVQGLHRRLMSLFGNHNTSSLTYRPCCRHLNRAKMPINAGFNIPNDEKTLQLYGNASHCQLNVAIWTRPHPEKHCIISWWLMFSPACGPSATNHLNCLLVALKRHHRNCNCVVPNVFCIVETTEILIEIDVVCKVGKSLETQHNVIL